MRTRVPTAGTIATAGPPLPDMDGDGDLDLFLGGLHDDPSKIYENQGDCRFRDVTANSPDIVNMLATHTLSPSFGDYDLDGDLDLFLTHWGTSDRVYAEFVDEKTTLHETDHLWRNESNESGIRFVKVSEETGISNLLWSTREHYYYIWPQDADFTFTATFARINDDAWPDIAVVADFGTTQVALNSGDGKFGELQNPTLRDAQNGMGSALGDIDNDGDLDIFHTNGWSEPYLNHQVWQMPTARAFVMNAAGTYEDKAAELGLGGGRSGRGIVCADFDNDADTDWS